MTNRTRLVSGRVVTSNSANVTADRYQYLDLSSAEPNLGTGNVGDVLIYDTAYPGGRRWIPQTSIAGAVGQQAFNKANAAFDAANTGTVLAQAAYNQANVTIGVDTSQNARMTIIEGVNATQNTNISNKVNLTGSLNQTVSGNVTIGQDLIVSGNLVITGNISSQNVQQLAVADPLIVLGIGNYLSDTKDIGFAAHYNDGTNAHAGLIRDSGTKEFYVFQGYVPELDANNNVVITDPSFRTANLNANYVKSNLISTTASVNGLDISSVWTTQNSRMTIIEGVDVGQNTRMAIADAVNASQNVRLDYSNTVITIIQGTDTSQNARMTIIEGVDVGQNTSIASTDGKMQSAYGQANTGTVLAQASYNFANNISSSLSGNSIVLGSNTTGLLVSNAVTLTTGTFITNGLAQINQVLGKLVPPSPPNFPGAYRSITINSLVGPYRMTNFTQQDNSANSRTVAGGTSTTVLRSSSYTTSTLINVGPGDSGTVTVFKNNVSAGADTLLTGNGNAGTYNDLVILNNVDYGTITGSALGFWSSINVRASGAVANGWNEVYIGHSGTGDRTNVAFWYYDNSAPGTPTFTSASIVPLSTSLTYSSTVPHYNSSTTFRLGVNVSKLSGDMYPATDTFFTGAAGGAFGAPASNTYSAVGITTPLIRNLYVSSGSVTVNTTSSIISGFNSSSTGPSVTVDNSYTTGSQVFTSALANTVLYKTGTASAMEETSITFGSTVGTGSGLAARIINPGTTDTPTYTASAALFNSTSSTLTANDATIVAATLKHDQTNYSTGYLPAGPNLSTGRTGSQYFTFRFVRTSVSKFDIKYTGTIAGLWVALPGSDMDTTSSINGWMDMSTAYAGSGHPGVNVGGNGSNGCALGGNAVLNSLVTNGSYTCTFGDVSSSSTATNEIYVRIKLTSSQTVSALTLQTASH
jgi:hypothetical protein